MTGYFEVLVAESFQKAESFHTQTISVYFSQRLIHSNNHPIPGKRILNEVHHQGGEIFHFYQHSACCAFHTRMLHHDVIKIKSQSVILTRSVSTDTLRFAFCRVNKDRVTPNLRVIEIVDNIVKGNEYPIAQGS